MALGNINNISSGKKVTLNLVYTPATNSQDSGQTTTPLIFSIGDNKNQISLDLLAKIIQYAKYGEDSGSKVTFKDVLAEAMYKGLSDTEKSILQALKTDKEGFANSQLIIHEEDVEEKPILMGVPTDEYLNDLKMMEEIYIKNQELIKFYKKMARISGNLPMDEMVQDVSGTSIRLSNLHVTDINRLNDLKIHSTAF
jgi:hypothetical protein